VSEHAEKLHRKSLQLTRGGGGDGRALRKKTVFRGHEKNDWEESTQHDQNMWGGARLEEMGFGKRHCRLAPVIGASTSSEQVLKIRKNFQKNTSLSHKTLPLKNEEISSESRIV